MPPIPGSRATPLTATPSVAVVVMAGGQGTRMRSAVPKVLHRAGGRALLDWVLDAASAVEGVVDARSVVVVGHEAETVAAHLATTRPGVATALQPERRGTGDAARVGVDAPALAGHDGDVLVLSGDVPCLPAAALDRLLDRHRATGAHVTPLTFVAASPGGYGRVIRDGDGAFVRIVEARDATPDELSVTEVNAGVYVFAAGPLREALARLVPDNDQGELYLTDTLASILAAGGRVEALAGATEADCQGVNTRADLARVHAHLNARILDGHLLAGVHVVDPTSTWIEHGVALAPDARVEPFTVLSGATTVAAGAVVGPHAVVVDSQIGPGATVGPFASLRGGTVLAEHAKAGTFVELKRTALGARTKVPHLSYLGDATVGSHTNIGASNVTANYDGRHKHPTRIGSRVKTGVDTTFIAPVTVADDALTAAGSVVTDDVPAGALAIARSRQRNVEGYAARRADAAAAPSPPRTADPDPKDVAWQDRSSPPPSTSGTQT